MPDHVREADVKLYMRNLSVLIVSSNAQECSIVSQILVGFGVSHTRWMESAADALAHVQHESPDLMIVDAYLPITDGYNLIRALRSAKASRSRAAPIILMAGHIKLADAQRARDCGASIVMLKPVKSAILFGRIAWLAKDDRAFIDGKTYVGPDRRFRKLGPPPNTAGRRADDLSLSVGEATSDNMRQSEIDAMLKPKAIAR